MRIIPRLTKHWKPRLAVAVGALVVAYVAACVYFWSSQVEKIFDPVAEIFTDPGRMGIAFEPVQIPVSSGGEQTILDGIWVPAVGESPPDDAPSFLYLHGQDTTIGKNLNHTLHLAEMGYNVLVVDYRGYGNHCCETKPSEASVKEDAEAAWQYLIHERGATADKSFIYGHSLGGAIAIDLATKHDEAAGLITESTFTSIIGMSEERHPIVSAILPMRLLIRHPFDSISKIGDLGIPVLLIHGDADAKIPCEMIDELYDAAPDRKEKLLVQGGEHANCSSNGSVEYREKLSAFVDRCISGEWAR
jgi:alpha-beta hydrolase superfamily lysophospholipase